MKINLCQLKSLKLFCMGCCGHDFTSKKDIEEAIKKNTITYKKSKNKKKWGERSPFFVRPCGLCYNLIKDNNHIFCPLHPDVNNGIDMRDEDCEKDYMCKTFRKFNQWNEKKQTLFLKFLKNKNLDWFEYSLGMDSGFLLREFEDFLNKNNK